MLQCRCCVPTTSPAPITRTGWNSSRPRCRTGPLSSRLQCLQEVDKVIVSRKATGTLVIDNLEDGRNLYLIGTGAGIAPFLSVIKNPETYMRFENIVLLHGCRRVACPSAGLR